MTAAVRPPRSLGKAGRELWVSIANQWAADGLLPDARETRLLTDAAHEADILAALERDLAAAIDRGELTTRGSMGQKITHPHVGECRRSRAEIRAALLKLGFEDPAAAKKKTGEPITAAEAGRRGAHATNLGRANRQRGA